MQRSRKSMLQPRGEHIQRLWDGNKLSIVEELTEHARVHTHTHTHTHTERERKGNQAIEGRYQQLMWTLYGRVSQPWHCWHLRPDNSLLYFIQCKIFGSIPGLYRLDSSRLSLVAATQTGLQKLPNVFRVVRSQIASSWAPLLLAKVRNVDIILSAVGSYWNISGREW